MSPYFTTKCFWCSINELSKAVTTIAFDSHLIYSYIFIRNSKLLKISVHHVRRHLTCSHVCFGWANYCLENESWCWKLFLVITVWVDWVCLPSNTTVWWLYIYIYIYMCVIYYIENNKLYIYSHQINYIYIYIYRERERERATR